MLSIHRSVQKAICSVFPQIIPSKWPTLPEVALLFSEVPLQFTWCVESWGALKLFSSKGRKMMEWLIVCFRWRWTLQDWFATSWCCLPCWLPSSSASSSCNGDSIWEWVSWWWCSTWCSWCLPSSSDKTFCPVFSTSSNFYNLDSNSTTLLTI